MMTGLKSRALRLVEKPKVFWGYTPVVQALPKLVQALPKLLLAGSSLFGDLPVGSDAELLEQIRKSCKSGPAQISANLAVAAAIIKWRRETGARGVIVSPEPYRSSVDAIRFCADVAVVISDQLYVINLDCRSQMNLSNLGKEFMKSIIHHTALIGDLKTANVAILRTPEVSSGSRTALLEVLEGEPTFSMNEVDRLILETYSIWETILMARRSEGAGEAGSDGGGFI